MYFSNPAGWNIVNTEKLTNAADHLRGTKVTCGTYETLLTAPGEDVLVYLDPPYFVNTELSTTSRLYKYNFEKEDHDRMAELVQKCKHKVVVSYDNHPYISELYKGLNLSETEWTYCGTSSAEGQSDTKQIGKELIITNF